MAPFNLIVTWTWPILGLATVLYSLGLAATSNAGQNVILSGSYALSSGTLTSNFCAGALYASGDPDSFTICDWVGIGVGALVEGARIHYTFGESEWDYVMGIPKNTREGIIHTFEDSVNGVKETALILGRSVKHTERKFVDLRQ